MDELLKQMMKVAVSKALSFGDFDEAEMWKLEELLDEYIDKRIERRLDQEFDRGEYSHW
jgi:hypothetical protein